MENKCIQARFLHVSDELGFDGKFDAALSHDSGR